MNSKKLTKKGYLALRTEFDFLSQKERPKVVQGVATAAAEGDRSENAEYIYGKKRLREIDKRLQYLSRLLKDPTVIDTTMVSTTNVDFGTRVTVMDESGIKKTWTIVGEGEADYKTGTISASAPVAQALLGKSVHDIVEIDLAKGPTTYEILEIAIGDID